MMVTKRAILAVVCIVTAAGAHAEIYKCVVDGKIEFTDRECVGTSGDVMRPRPSDGTKATLAPQEPRARPAPAAGAREAIDSSRGPRVGDGSPTGMTATQPKPTAYPGVAAKCPPRVLIDAAKNGDVDGVKNCLQGGADLAAKDDRGSEGRTALHWAAVRGHDAVVELLLRHGADPNARTSSPVGPVPLHMASGGGHPQVAIRLIAAGADVNADCWFGSPLHAAASKRRLNTVGVLLASGAKVDAVDGNGETPLHEAARSGAVDVADLLIEHGANVDTFSKSGFSPLEASASQGTKDVATLLIARGAAVNDPISGFSRSLFRAVGTDRIDMVELLLRSGARAAVANETGSTALHNLHRNAGIGRLLINAGADVNARAKDGRTPLHNAVSSSSDAARVLLSMGADPGVSDQNGQTPLYFAWGVDRRVIELMLAKGAKVNERDRTGSTPLLAAVRAKIGGSDELALHLIDLGADVNVADENGVTPLIAAAYAGKEAVVAALIGKRANLYATCPSEALEKWPVPPRADKISRTARMWAEFKGHNRIAEMLRTAIAR